MSPDTDGYVIASDESTSFLFKNKKMSLRVLWSDVKEKPLSVPYKHLIGRFFKEQMRFCSEFCFCVSVKNLCKV